VNEKVRSENMVNVLCQALTGLLLLHVVSAKAVSKVSPTLPESFNAFMQMYGRSYQPDSQEYALRQDLYKQRLAEVHTLNSRPERLWTATVNRLSDRTEAELQELRGWRGGTSPAASGGAQGQQSTRASFLSLKGRTKPLPEQVSWTQLNASKSVRNQGSCGSCWAIAAATVLDTHAEIHAPQHARSFSAQELVSCVPNPESCGGEGGCEGATVELAMDWAMQNGLAKEAEVPYQEVTGQCQRSSPSPASSDMIAAQVAPATGAALRAPGVHSAQAGNLGTSFGMTGWERLPENGYEALMRAVAERGPVAVSAAASSWYSYMGGVFDHCERNAVIDHAITLVGYGVDNQLQEKYWLVQNSWGPDWGEDGRIRILRKDSDGKEQCGIDAQPELGTGCKGGPKQVTVCGMCGILYDSVVPYFGDSAASPNLQTTA